MSSEKARNVRQKGYEDALEFAKLIGVEKDYKNNLQAKKDVIDRSGDTHSVKSGSKKWQIFLYSANRHITLLIFKRLNGLGDLMLKCLNVFPEKFSKIHYKKMKFWMKKDRTFQLLQSCIHKVKEIKKGLFVYVKAILL